MSSLTRTDSSSASNPVLDVEILDDLDDPLDVAVLEFRILDISTDTKKAVPVQVHPTTDGTYEVLDPTVGPPTGHRLGVGHYFAPWTVPVDEPLGDHRIEWRFKATLLDVDYETSDEEFYVAATPPSTVYCSVEEIRAEGYEEDFVTDNRIEVLALMATRYIEKVTRRWFYPRTFDGNARFVVDGSGGKQLPLEVPIIRLDALFLENPGLAVSELTAVDVAEVRVYNRHLTGMINPDDRNHPRLAFNRQGHVTELVATGLYPYPRYFPKGSLTVHMEGVFGYTDPDGTEFGMTPDLIRRCCRMLVERDLRLDVDACEKFNDKVRYRIIGDREGNHSVTLNQIWLKGAFTGDAEIDQILQMFCAGDAIRVV